MANLRPELHRGSLSHAGGAGAGGGCAGAGAGADDDEAMTTAITIVITMNVVQVHSRPDRPANSRHHGPQHHTDG
eukprot:768359-Hanusia_phi.AAC.2